VVGAMNWYSNVLDVDQNFIAVLERNGIVARSSRATVFTETVKRPIAIYGVYTEEDELIYVGQTDQQGGSVDGLDDRLSQHKQVKVDWAGKNYYIEYIQRPRLLTDFEACSWEQYYITVGGGAQSQNGTLQNKQRAITPKNFEQYKHLHNDYPTDPEHGKL